MSTLFENGCHAVEQGLTGLCSNWRVGGYPMSAKQLWRWQGINATGHSEEGALWADDRAALPVALEHQHHADTRKTLER